MEFTVLLASISGKQGYVVSSTFLRLRILTRTWGLRPYSGHSLPYNPTGSTPVGLPLRRNGCILPANQPPVIMKHLSSFVIAGAITAVFLATAAAFPVLLLPSFIAYVSLAVITTAYYDYTHRAAMRI